MVFSCVYGPPFVLEGDVRRNATMEDFRNFTKLAQSFGELDSAGGVICEPDDTPLDSRHLDMIYALQTLTDKIYMGNVVSGPNAADTIRMTEILFGGRESIERTPAMISLVNCNSPLRWDGRMLDSLFEYANANQALLLTPFLLMGAMSPVSIPATLAQQIAEALAGIALVQLIRPGCPVIFGSFLSNIDMQSGSPQFGTPESAIGLLLHGPDRAPLRPAVPLRRRPDLEPDARRAVGVRGADGDAADVPRRHELGDALGRLARGRPRQLATRSSSSTSRSCGCCRSSSRRSSSTRRRSRSTRTRRSATAATSSAASTRWSASARASTARCSPRRRTSTRWTKKGSKDAAARASDIWKAQLESYEQPPLDDAIREELEEYVVRRRRELGD